ncbi:transcriptional regulator, TetR family [Aeromicrobium marinum DSM 15272]|uniref:Transcriptional regulator, TetR family n=1 Tax=Aeromicrobium marinum DSM 15272 TaxID=585531 RepID=E2SBY8_9ACTN|nr:TetR/AcrR family transcriptional regulator [Aeromicrobium marinum]EFQ83274.1 transcriptional regulator, TetR family [Aeromicrobium marinum DSM 15272]
MVTGKRMKAEDRKRLILDAAIVEYGSGGLHETSTEAIAERAGVSQPYLFRLFGTKQDLIIAAIHQHTDTLRGLFARAVAERGELSPLDAMGEEYARILAEDPNSLRCQLHTWAAAGDPAIGPVARSTYLEILDDIRRLSGASDEEITDFMAHGMLMTVAAALDIPDLACSIPTSSIGTTTPPSPSPQDD